VDSGPPVLSNLPFVEQVVIVGVGELGGVFARGFLRLGLTVVPVIRSTDPSAVAGEVPHPRLCLVAVGETDLSPTLASLPSPWKGRVGLLQNELLPRTWLAHDIADPTVAVVWFEKKPGQDVKQIISTPVAGPEAPMMVAALSSITIAAHEATASEVEQALVAKNLYILTANIAGLETRGSVQDLWYSHRDLAESVTDEIADLQRELLGHEFDRDAAKAEMVRAFDADPNHGSMGRSAPVRLRRALQHADAFGREVPTLRRLAADHLEGA